MAMRATAVNPQVASLMGVNSNRVTAAAFVIGSALGALAGVMVGTHYEIARTRWASCSASRRSRRPLGGIGNLAGGDGSAASCSASSRRSGAGYIGDPTGGFLKPPSGTLRHPVLIVVLMFKPSGLFGEKTETGHELRWLRRAFSVLQHPSSARWEAA